MPTKTEKEEPTPTFIFKGTVMKLRSATMENVPVSDRTTVVRVDQIIEAPTSLSQYAGKEVTVQLSGRGTAKVGQEMMFYTGAWIFGDSVAVQSVRQEPVKASHAALLDHGGDPVERLRNRQIQAHFDDAHLVLSGKVTAVRFPSTSLTRAKSKNAAEEETDWKGPASEHDPKWQEAVIEVTGLHKGKHPRKTIVVRFPSSTDVRWYKAPKFQPGQRGYFMLHKVKSAQMEPTKAMGSPTRGPKAKAEIYAVLHPEDFQPYDQDGGLKALLDSAFLNPREKKRHGR